MCLPRGQEAELAGFYVYCTQILGWLPPLLFTICVQSDIPQKYGVIITAFGFVVSVLLLSCTGSWEEIVAEADKNQNVNLTGFEDEDKKKRESPTPSAEIETTDKSVKKGSEEEDEEEV
jgi:hypothetical protein